MKKAYVPFLLLLALLFSGCTSFPFGSGSKQLVGSGKVATESRTIAEFSAIDISGPGNLIVIQGDTDELTLEADDNILSYIETKVLDGVLHIDLNIKPYESITIKNQILYKVQMKVIDSLALSGGGSITAQNISAGILKVSVDGGGVADLAGTCTHLAITINGEAKFQAGKLHCREGQISVNGGAAVTVWASDNLAVTGVGATVINYYGSPKISQNGSNIVMTNLGVK